MFDARFAPALALALLFAAACADTPTMGTPSLATCRGDQDCLNGQTCHPDRRVCVDGGGDNNGDNDGQANNGTNDGTNNGTDNNGACPEACREHETCVEGRCVCDEGANRACGSKAGECRYGTQTCDGGTWGNCVGGVEPTDEVCDQLDNDCDGEVDDGVLDTWFLDLDNDGYGVDDDRIQACEAQDGYSSNTGDCDDDDRDRHPGVPEACDGVDNDCDGDIDEAEDLDAPPGDLCEPTGVCADGTAVCRGADGWSCLPPETFEADETRCDGLDNDCDGMTDENLGDLWYADTDGDGFGDPATATRACTRPDEGTWVAQANDCAPDDPTIHPDAAELCDGLDNDCDRFIDLADDQIVPAEAGLCGTEGICALVTPVCNGAQGWSCPWPGTREVGDETRCDGLDNDCDGMTDEGVAPTWYLDGDDDGHGDDATASVACHPPTADHVDRGGDCAPMNPAIHPGAAEVCDGVDNDCDNATDADDTGLRPPPADHCLTTGLCAALTPLCTGVDGWLCRYPASWEPDGETRCDGEDNDCDGMTDEDLTTRYYPDQDGDTWGETNAAVDRCTSPGDGWVLRGGDCAPTVTAIHPDATEVCDGADNDCDTRTDTADPDLVPAAANLCGTRGLCALVVPGCRGAEGWSCDYPANWQPDGETLCDNVDNDCDGMTDEGLTTRYFPDGDDDTWGDDATAVDRCTSPGNGWILRGGDCAPTVNAIHPGATETCDGLDNDCDRRIDGLDDDMEAVPPGYCGTDGVCRQATTRCAGLLGWACDYPTTWEPDVETRCDGLDNDCDAMTDEGVCAPPTAVCPPNLTTVEGAAVQLTGSGADPDGGPVSFAWSVTAGPGGPNYPLPSPTNAATTTWTPVQIGTFNLRMCVTDDENAQTCCNTTVDATTACTPPAAPDLSACGLSWDRRPIVEFTPLPAGMVYELFVDGAQNPHAVISLAGQNYYRPASALPGGGPPPQGAPVTLSARTCRADNRACCSDPQAVTVHLIEACTQPIAPSANNIIISEYLINGGPNTCPSPTCEAGEAVEITNLSHCPITLANHHFRYCNTAACGTFRFMNFGPSDIIPPRGVYVAIRNPSASTCAFDFMGQESSLIFGLRRSTLELEVGGAASDNNGGWFGNGSDGTLRIGTSSLTTGNPNAGTTITLISPYLHTAPECASIGFDALNACGDIPSQTTPTDTLDGNQLGRLWHPCDAVLDPVPDTCFD